MSAAKLILDSIADEVARADRTDGQLLDLFVRGRDEEAFAAVVRRHGPMVLGVCRRVLRNSADADDAFQAAFLVLARKAATIGTRDLLAQWLYGVAYNTARKLRHSNTRRALREVPLSDKTEPLANAPEPRDELLAILDEELNLLPDRYRVVLVLCDLEGLTRREVARLLNCPEGTVGGRLARARALLAERLERRGVVSAAGVLVAVLTERAATAIPIAGVIRAIGVDDLARAAAQGLISPRVAQTTDGVLKGMFATKLRTVAAAVLCCGLALACGAGAIHFANAQPSLIPKSDPKPFLPDRKPDSVPMLTAGDKPAVEKKLTVFPLTKLDPKETAATLVKTFPVGAATVTALPKDKALMVYASEAATAEVAELLKKLGEPPLKRATAFRSKNGRKATEDAEVLRTLLAPRDVVIVPVADEGIVLLYADEEATQLARKVVDEVSRAKEPPKPAPKKFAFRMKNAKWDDVLEAYSKLSGLTMITTVKPKERTFTFDPPAGSEFTIAEITDILNEALEQQKFILIRRHMTFFIHPADEKLDPTLVPRIAPDELEHRGRTEMAQVILLVRGIDVLEAQDAAKKMLSAFGSTIALKNAILVHDTAGRLVRIRDVLAAMEKAAEPKKDTPKAKTYTVAFRNTPWAEVLDWYSKESGLTLTSTVKPTGTATIAPGQDRKFTFGEITDLINETLAQQKFILVRRNKSFFLHPADEKIDPTAVRRVELSELPELGRTEIVEVTLTLKNVDVGEVKDELRKLLTPFGTIVFAKGKTLVVCDTAGNIARIREVIEAIDGPAPKAIKPDPRKPADTEPVFKTLSLKKLKTADVAKAIEKEFAEQRVLVVALPNQNQLMVLAPADVHDQIAKFVRELEEKAEKK